MLERGQLVIRYPDGAEEVFNYEYEVETDKIERRLKDSLVCFALTYTLCELNYTHRQSRAMLF